MKLNSRFDVEAPIDRVFAELANFEQWEREAMRRGTEVNRTDKLTAPGPGMTWAAQFLFRGKRRNVTLDLERMEPPAQLAVMVRSEPVDLELVIELVELSTSRTRMHLSLEILPKALSAKLYVQSLRLAKARVERKFRGRVSQFVLELEDRIRRA